MSDLTMQDLVVLDTSQHLVHAPGYSQPYLTSLAFIAHDFRQWGHVVTTHPGRSEDLTEVRYGQRNANLAKTRPYIIEVWAKEVMRRHDAHSVAPPVFSQEDKRIERLSAMAGDFIKALAGVGATEAPARIRWYSAKCLQLKHMPWPKDPALNLVVLYMRLLQSVTQHRGIKDHTHKDLAQRSTVVDDIVLQFWPNDLLKSDPLEQAVNRMPNIPGRRTELAEKDRLTGTIKLHLFVDVSDIVEEGTRIRGVEEQLPPYD
jgi:hypothetical protein